MYSTSKGYKTANLESYRQFEARISIGNRIITNEEVVSINLQQSIQQEPTFTLGNAISSILNLTFLHNDIETSDRDIINLEIGLLVNGVYEYVQMGVFNIDSINSNDTTTSIIAYDNMIRFDTPYAENNSSPTVHSVINRLIELTGVELSGTLSNYTNYNLIPLSGYTCREVLGFIAGTLGCNTIIDRQGKFKLIGITKTSSITITNENYFNYAKQSKLYKISKIVNEVEGKIQEKGSLTDDTVCLYVYNPLVNETILQSLYNKFYDFSFLPFELSWSGDLSLDLGDSIQIVDKKGNSLIQPILSQIFTYTGGLSSVIQSQGDTKLANTYTTSTSEEKEAERIIKRVVDIENTDTVTNISYKYYLSTSKTELAGGKWVDTLPSIAEQQGKFLWVKYVTTYSDTTQSESDAICMTGQDGKNGTDGVDGLPGAPGKDGKTYYTWIKYSNNADGSNMTDNPDSLYMGIAVNKTTQTESNNASDYTWSLIKGADGVPGPPGADGETLYTWIKYADNASGGGMSNSPDGKTYIGLAYNKTTNVESNNANDYTWSLIKGADGVSVTELVIEYAKNQSITSAPTSGWSTTMPSYAKGYYLWMRTRIKYSNNSNYVYSTPTCDQSWKVVAQTYSEYEQLKDKFGWLVKSGTSESNMVLTDKLYSLMTSKVLIEAKKIELNGSININDGMFKVATSGNLKIGGTTGQVIDNYERAQFEVTSDGNMYSVSNTDVDTYTKISEGYIYCSDGSEDVRIKGGSIVAHSVGSNNIGNRTGTKLTLTGGISEIEICEISGNKFLRPASSDGNTRLGSSSNYFYQAWIKNGVTTSSDRNLKENIRYLHKNKGLSQEDFYNFIRDDFLQALYNYIGDTETRISLIAQDILVDKYGNDNSVGQMITNAREAFRNNTTLNIKETQLVNVIGGALRELILRFEKVEAIVNEK